MLGCFFNFAKFEEIDGKFEELLDCVFGVAIFEEVGSTFEEFDGLEEADARLSCWCVVVVAVAVVEDFDFLSDGVVTAAGVNVFLEEFSSEAGGAMLSDFAFFNGGGGVAIEGEEV